jgi:hypothetical protein
VALLGLIVLQSACTLVGYGIGSAIDSGNKRTIAAEDITPDTIKPGKAFTLRLRDGGTVDGRYFGIEPLPAEEYAARYAATRERHLTTVPLPELRDTVTLSMMLGSELSAEFLGFDFYKVLIWKPGAPLPQGVRPGDIDNLLVEGSTAIEGETLTLLLSEGALPFHSAFVMQAPPTIGKASSQRLLPVDQVLLIEWKPSTGRTVGAIVGATIDAAVLVAITYCAFTECLEFYVY